MNALSEARFKMLSGDYDQEQAELCEKIDQLTKEIAEQESLILFYWTLPPGELASPQGDD